MTFTERDLSSLRDEVKKRLSLERYAHTLSVEAEVAEMGKLYLPQDIEELRVAALLHDITKVGSSESQIELCHRLNLHCTDEEMMAPQVLHGKTAAAIISREFPKYATTRVISAVEKHTVGQVEMSCFDMIVFVADYIEGTREIQNCQDVRRYFWDASPEVLTSERHLKMTMCIILKNTLEYLEKKNAMIDPRTRGTYLWLCRDLGLMDKE